MRKLSLAPDFRQLSDRLIQRFREKLRRPWFVTGLSLIGIALVLTLVLSKITIYRITLFPVGILLLAAVYSWTKDYRLNKRHPAPAPEKPVRSTWHEALRVSLWLFAFLAYLIWGLNGSWLFASSLLLLAGLLEGFSDWLIIKRRKK